MADSLRKKLDSRMSSLRNERDSSWKETWRELSDYIEPRTGRWCLSDTNDGKRRDQKIINGTSTYAARVLEAGMRDGITSPARPWFKLGTPDPSLADYAPVKLWLNQAEVAMREVFAKSNLYNTLTTLYGEAGIFGTGAMAVMPDARDVVRFYPFTIGSYMLANSDRLQVDTLYREFRMTARQMEQQFGRSKMSSTAQSLLDTKPDAWVDICHANEPNDTRVTGMRDNKNMAFRSVYWEKGGDSDKTLSESGFEQFPIMAPRWKVNGEDVYGRGPGALCIGDNKALQLMEKRKAQLLAQGATPAMAGPASLKGQKASIIPGDITYVSDSAAGQKFAPIYMPDPTWYSALRGEIQAHEERINTAFFVDLFLMISQMDSVRTATEIAARKEEKMLMLGPVLERLNDELLDPLIDRTFAIMLEQSVPRWAGLLPGKPLLPPPPQELAGMDLRVEYISILAQAQKAMGVGAIERTLGFAGNIAGIDQSVLDNINFDSTINEYASMIGVPPSILNSQEQVQQIREQRAKAQQQQAAMEQMGAAVQGAKLLSETDVSSDNALTSLIGAA